MIQIRAIAGVLGVFLALSAGLSAQIPGAERIEAIVNDTVITRYDVDKALEESKIDLSKLSKSEQKDVLRRQLTDLVLSALQKQAAKKAGLSVSEEQFLDSRTRLIEDQFHNEAAFRQFLERHGQSEQEWNENFRAQLETQAWLQVASGLSGAKSLKARPQYDLSVTPREMRRFYRENKDKLFHETEAIHLRVIQVAFARGRAQDRIRALQDITAVKRKLATKADFAVLARRVSTHPSKKDGGDLGWVEKGSDAITPPIEKAVFKKGVKAGDLIGPLKIVNAYWLIRIEGRRRERTIGFAEAQNKIRRILRNEKVRRALLRVQLNLVRDSYIYPRRLKRDLLEYFRTQRTR